jgi:glycosyltransferase involved in cell wall biosynthesis
MIETYGLTQTVTLTPNASNEELIDAMSKSIMYFHTMIGEHFGVSIVEAMAAGLVPIVSAYGGCSEIIASGYHYRTLEEAAQYIAKNAKIADDEKRIQMHDIARQFSPDNFRKAMKNYIEQAKSQASMHRSSRAQ